MTAFKILTFQEFADWLAKQSVSRLVKQIQNHHTFLPSYAQFKGSNHVKMMHGMEASHLERGFAEIAQQFTTFPDGKIGLGRSMNTIPAGIKGANQTGICIEHIGNFNVGGDVMTPEHRDIIIGLNAALCNKFGLKPSTDSILYHHWYDLNTAKRTNGTGSTKTCPGTNFFGGNTVADCQQNFIPLVEAALTTTQTTAATYKMEGYVTVPKLNVRSLPTPNADIVDKIKQGALVRVFEEANGWYRIASSTSKWVKAEYISDHNAAESTT